MSKLLVGDLRNIEKEITKERVIEVGGDLKIKVKQYLPILDKVKLMSTIYQSAIDEYDTLQVIDYNSLNITYSVLVVDKYSDITLPKDTIQAYDLLMSTGLYDEIYSRIPARERQELENTLENLINEKQVIHERENTLQNVVRGLVSDLIDKIPSEDEASEFIEKAKEQLNNMNPDNLKLVQDFLAKTQGEDIG